MQCNTFMQHIISLFTSRCSAEVFELPVRLENVTDVAIGLPVSFLYSHSFYCPVNQGYVSALSLLLLPPLRGYYFRTGATNQEQGFDLAVGRRITHLCYTLYIFAAII